MRHPPKISIIVNNYNYGRFLGEAIDSALAQTYAHVEVVVVDDGSTDNSREIIGRYGDRIIPVLKENGGQASAFNAGFAASRGELVFFLDSDDILLPEAAETVAHSWREGLARIFFPLEAVDAVGQPLRRLIGGQAVPDPTLGPFGVDSPTSGNAFSREVLEKIMPVPAHRVICADACLTSASSLLGEVIRLGRPLGKYRVHGKNSVAGAKMGLPEIRRAIRFTLSHHELLRRLGGDRIGPLDQWLGSYPQHWVDRITSLRESPSDHEWPDTLTGLMRRAIGATWRQPYWNPRRKLAYTAFVVGYSLAPGGLRRAMKRAEASTHSLVPRLMLGNKPKAERIRRIGTA